MVFAREILFGVALLAFFQTTSAGTIPQKSQDNLLQGRAIEIVPTFLQGLSPQIWGSNLVTWGRDTPVIRTNQGLLYFNGGAFQPVPSSALSIFNPYISQIPFVSVFDPQFAYVNTYSGVEVYLSSGVYFASVGGVMTPIPGFVASAPQLYNFGALPIVQTVPTSTFSSHSSHSSFTNTTTTTTTTAAVPIAP